VTPRAAIDGAVGRYPRDLVGFTDGLFATIGVRFGLTSAAVRSDLAPPVVTVEPLEAGRVRISFAVDQEVDLLEIAGDWNGWDPVRLVPGEKGQWSVELMLGQGIHRYALIVDGDRWTVPPGVLTEPDDFGGQVALLVVP
jgi:hypothetical protein